MKRARACTVSQIVTACLCLTMVPVALAKIWKENANTVVIAVSPTGNDNAAGTVTHPLRTLQRAQEAVRRVNVTHDVIVELEGGVYRLDRPLNFTAEDGGRNGHRVMWTNAPGTQPVLSGAMRVTGWKLWNKERDIYVANTPQLLDTRQLWVNGKLMRRGRIEIPRSDVSFSMRGMSLKGAQYDDLANLPEQNKMEIDATGFFTMRISPVKKVDGRTLVMQQPAWDNNIWGYDTIDTPYHPGLSHLYLVNSLAFVTKPGEWYIDPDAGKLYLRPPAGVDVNAMDVELPRLTVLMSVGDSVAAPVRDLTFHGIRFSYTTWLGPSTNEGYASQQSGSYITGRSPDYPANPLVSCKYGCPDFESVRSEWSQMPASVQVSAAHRITFNHDIFAHLGQYALGIGNDSDATLSGTGLGTSDVTVEASVFTDDAGGAILAGGVRPDAHHPPDPRQTNQDLVIRSNRIYKVSENYLDNSAILCTYFNQADILHNDISNVPYDAIDIGYGWGINDAGGNSNYRNRMHGYEFPANRVYFTPTTEQNMVVANNRIHNAKQLFHDGGAIYNLSANPGTLITENYIYDNHQRIALYLDEGSRGITLRKNVVDDPGGEWLNINTVHAAYPLRISPDNTATDNWHNSAKVGGMWINYENDLILEDHLVKDGQWPAEAQKIMQESGIEPFEGPVEYGGAGRTGGRTFGASPRHEHLH